MSQNSDRKNRPFFSILEFTIREAVWPGLTSDEYTHIHIMHFTPTDRICVEDKIPKEIPFSFPHTLLYNNGNEQKHTNV